MLDSPDHTVESSLKHCRQAVHSTLCQSKTEAVPGSRGKPEAASLESDVEAGDCSVCYPLDLAKIPLLNVGINFAHAILHSLLIFLKPFKKANLLETDSILTEHLALRGRLADSVWLRIVNLTPE